MIRANRRSSPVLAESSLLPWKVTQHLGTHVRSPRSSESSLRSRPRMDKRGAALEKEMKNKEGANVGEEQQEKQERPSTVPPPPPPHPQLPPSLPAGATSQAGRSDGQLI